MEVKHTSTLDEEPILLQTFKRKKNKQTTPTSSSIKKSETSAEKYTAATKGKEKYGSKRMKHI